MRKTNFGSRNNVFYFFIFIFLIGYLRVNYSRKFTIDLNKMEKKKLPETDQLVNNTLKQQL